MAVFSSPLGREDLTTLAILPMIASMRVGEIFGQLDAAPRTLPAWAARARSMPALSSLGPASTATHEISKRVPDISKRVPTKGAPNQRFTQTSHPCRFIGERLYIFCRLLPGAIATPSLKPAVWGIAKHLSLSRIFWIQKLKLKSVAFERAAQLFRSSIRPDAGDEPKPRI